MSYDKNAEKKTQAVLLLKMREMAEKYKMSLTEIEAICNAPFEFFKLKKDEASHDDADFPAVKIPYFLTFYVREGKKNFIKNNVSGYKGDSKINKDGE